LYTVPWTPPKGANEWGAWSWELEAVEIRGQTYLQLSNSHEAARCYHVTIVEPDIECPQFEGVRTRILPPMRVPREARLLGLSWQVVASTQRESLLRFSLARGIFITHEQYKWMCQLREAVAQNGKGRQANKVQSIAALVHNVFDQKSDSEDFKKRIVARLVNARQMGQRAKRRVDVLTVAAAEELDPDNKQDFGELLKIVLWAKRITRFGYLHRGAGGRSVVNDSAANQMLQRKPQCQRTRMRAQ
jgi:hypothetical protein